MTTKNLGPNTLGYLDPEGRAWETQVFQTGKSVLDKELNLAQDAIQDAEFRLRKRSLPSGWLSDDYLDTVDHASGVFVFAGAINQIALPQDLRAHVNGWLIRVGNTGSNTRNVLTLGAGPSGAGAKRTDLVVLEVWRRLIAPAPSAVGKSAAGRIWWNGNVKVASADDLTLNFPDDLIDATLNLESTRRVQIQYRLRVVPGVNLSTYPAGLDDPSAVANTVPASAAAPDGSATAFLYSNQSSVGDPGLWRAGDGNPANSLGTVDGYIYAIPVMAVFRRNTTAFNKNTNQNGGVSVTPGPSDRPDGLFHDYIVAGDIVDLRMGINPTGWDYQEVLTRNFQWVLDNALRTEITTTAIGGGVNGHTHIWADQIGLTTAHGGDGTTTGQTPAGPLIGEFDGVRRFFSDRAIIETMVVKLTPTGATWTNGETKVVNPAALAVYPYTAYNWQSFAPTGVSVVDCVRAVFIGNGAGKKQSLVGNDFAMTGVGEAPVPTMQFSIGTVPAGITNEPLYLTLAVMYPPGSGLTKTPTADYGVSSVIINNPGAMPVGSPVLFSAINDEIFDYPHRELFLTYRTVGQTISFSAGIADTINFPERVQTISSITINGVGYGGAVTLSPDGYTATLASGAFTTGEATVAFTAVRPFPQNGEQVTIYYEARAPQTVRDAILVSPLDVTPRCVSSMLYTLTVGSGSQDEAFPFPFQYVQQPGVYPTSGGTFAGDHKFDGSGELVFDNMGTNTGYVQLPALINYVANPNEASFLRVGGDVDAEGRSYFKSVPGGYLPSAFGQALKIGTKTRRTLLPVLAELRVDSSIGKKGQLVLLVFGAYYAPSQSESLNNAIAFDPDLSLNITSMSVYRIKGNLLNRRSA